jgi:hypothetical protein
VRIDIIAVRESVLEDHGLEGQDMGPAGLICDQNGIKEEPAIIIQRGDEIPLLLGSWCPEMMRGVMLNQLSGITGEHFSVMEGLLGFLQIKAVLFSSANNGGQGNFSAISFSQTVFDIAVFVRVQRDRFVLNDFLLNRQFLEKVVFKVLRDSRRSFSLVLGGEMFGIFSILFKEHEKPAFLYPQDLLEILSFYLILGITLDKFLHLIRGKSFVQLGHNLRPPLGF